MADPMTTDQDVLKAREICSRHATPTGRWLSGELDDLPEMRVALAAIRQTREECAAVADDHARRAWDIATENGQNVTVGSGRNYAGREIASAIRAMGT